MINGTTKTVGFGLFNEDLNSSTISHTHVRGAIPPRSHEMKPRMLETDMRSTDRHPLSFCPLGPIRPFPLAPSDPGLRVFVSIKKNLLHDAQARAIGDQIKTINALSRGGAVVSAKKILRYSLPMIRSLLQSELSLPQYGPVLCVQGEASREIKREPHIKPFPSLLASSQTPSIPIAWGFYCPITSSSHARVS